MNILLFLFYVGFFALKIAILCSQFVLTLEISMSLQLVGWIILQGNEKQK